MNSFGMKMFSMFSSLASNASGLAVSSSAPSNMTFWEKVGMFFRSFGINLYNGLLSLIYTLFYAIGKFVLNIVDFISLAVKELAGQNTISDLSNISKVSKTDMVFRFVFDSNVLKIVKALLALSIVLLIIFAIIALLKNEYDAFLGGAEDNSKGQILKRTLTSLFMIIMVPFLAFGGILMSNAVLTSIDRALGRRSGNSTIASEVFIASTYEANQYRKYADTGERIPILFDFEAVDASELELPQGGYSSEQMTSTMQEYLNKTAWQRGYLTWWMFYNKQFNTFEEINAVRVESEKNNTVNWTDFFDKNMQINKNEYYVMADLTEHLMRTGEPVYIVNAYKLMQEMGVVSEEKAAQYLEYKTIDSNKKVTVSTTSPFYQKSNGDYAFRVYYNPELAKDVPGIKFDEQNNKYYVEYTFNNTHDEAKGAMYIVCTKQSVANTNGTYTDKFVPLYNYPKSVNYYSGEFWSEYLAPGQLVVARGVFNKDGYPTAIRDNSGQIEFYRDEVRAPSLIDILPQITYESQDGKLNLMGGLNFAFKLITGIDISELVPKIYFRDDAWNLFTKREESVATLSAGELSIDYNFDSGVPLHGIISVKDVNILVLLFSSILLMSVLAKAMFGLVGRVFDLALLLITYPVFAATMPLDNGARFKKWTESFISKVFAAYGIVIEINLIFILVPVVAETNAIFRPEFVAENVRVRGMSVQSMTNYLNFGVWLMLYLVLFTFIKTASDMVRKYVGGDDVVSSGDKVSGEMKSTLQKVGNIITGKFLIDGAKRLTGDTKQLIPGSAIAAATMGKEARTHRKEKREMKADIARRKVDLQNGDQRRLAGQIAYDKDEEKKAKAKKAKKEEEEKRKKLLRGE